MGVSIYYSANRPRPLTSAERTTINAIESRFPIEALLAECGVAENDFDGEAFTVYSNDEDTEPGVVFEGATRLPLCSDEAFWVALQYWCWLLSEVRLVLPDADWHVHVDDHDIVWDEESQQFDPSS